MSILENLGKDWPELISRKQAARLTGGIVNPRTLSNLDSQGKGPAERLRIGRKTCYPKPAFLDWLKSRATAER